MKVKAQMASISAAIDTKLSPKEISQLAEKYQNNVKEVVDFLNQPENIQLVQSGKEGSIIRTIEIPLGFLVYWPKDMVESGDIIFEYWHIQNSPYNRDPFLNDEKTLVDKVAYVIRYLYGVADFNLLPASIISNPINKPDASIQMSNCVLAKDRGHFMTVWYLFINEGIKKSEKFWKQVAFKLQLENKNYAFTKELKQFADGGLVKTISSLKEKGVKEFSLQQIIPTYYYNKIYTKKETIKISLETLETHKSEIVKINNDDNKWEPHNYGMVELTQELIHNQSWDYNPYFVESACAESLLCNGKLPLLSSVRHNNYSGFQTEVLLLKYCADLKHDSNKKFESHLLYKEYAGCNKKERGSLYQLIFTKRITTEKIKAELSEIEEIASSDVWERLDLALENAKEIYKVKGGINLNAFDKFKPSSLDTGLTYIRLVQCVMASLKARGSVFSLKEYAELVGNHIISVVNDHNSFFSNIDSTTKSWKGRFEKFFYIWFDEIKTIQEKELGEAGSEDYVRKLHIKNLKSKGLPTKFKMYDRRSENLWEIVDIDFDAKPSKSGLQLCHFKASKNLSVENTFMGPAMDNNFQGNKNLAKNYLKESFLKDFKQKVGITAENAEAWVNTQRFCEAF